MPVFQNRTTLMNLCLQQWVDVQQTPDKGAVLVHCWVVSLILFFVLIISKEAGMGTCYCCRWTCLLYLLKMCCQWRDSSVMEPFSQPERVTVTRLTELLTKLQEHRMPPTPGFRCTTQLPYAVITLAIRLRYDYDLTTTYHARLSPFDASKKWTCQFFVVVVSYRRRIAIVI